MEFMMKCSIPVEDLKDLVTVLFVWIDDLYRQYVPLSIQCRRHKDKAILSDSEIVTLAVLGDILSTGSENAWIAYVRKNWSDLFPRMCERSRFNRLRRQLYAVISQIRIALGAQLDGTMDPLRIIDSLPLPVCVFGRARYVKAFKGENAQYGYCASKKETYFGYKIHALCTANGYITDFLLTPASTDDRDAVWELLDTYQHHLTLIGDKGYMGAAFAENLQTEKGVVLLTLKRRNTKHPAPSSLNRAVFHIRRRIETSFSQLTGQFNMTRVYAKTLWGLTARLQSKILAYNLCFAINLLNGCEHPAWIKSLAF